MPEVSELVRALLSKRGIVEDEQITAFLNPDYALHTHDPFLLSGMDVAVDRLLLAMERNERIAIYADFDCDGIPGAAILHDLFKKIGYENFETYLPHRDREGYGFHEAAIKELAEMGVSLIITVDVGTNAVSAAAFAKGLGIDVIITDHHEILGALPEAVAVLNPKVPPPDGGYPFPNLCGAAVAFKLAQALIAGGRERGFANFQALPLGWEKWLLDLVAIATVADLVPLLGENRVLAHYGLRVLRKSPRAGIGALCARTRVKRAELSEDDIAFTIAPRINAASRMDDARIAYDLLTVTERAKADDLAAKLEELNAARKGIVAAIVRSAKKHVKQRYQAGEKIVVLGNPEWKPSLLGPAANSILESRRLPDGSQGLVCLWGRDGSGKLKGSCRSDGSVSVVELFSKASHAFEEFGGHERAGGFTVSHESVHSLPEALSNAALGLKKSDMQQSSNEFDALLTLSEISRVLFDDVSKLGPFGIGNRKPAFLISETMITEVRRFGRDQNHTEVMLECRRTGARARAFDFFAAPEQFSLPPQPGIEARICATLERDSYRGGYALRLVDVLSA